MTTKRTDIHRPGAIIPADYDSWLWYSMPGSGGGYPMPAIGLDCRQPIPVFDGQGRVVRYDHPTCPDTGRCCVRSAKERAEAEGRAIFGHAGKCGVCGACFRDGVMFRHVNGEMVHMGHDCADKYEVMADWSSLELAHERDRKKYATAIQREMNEAARKQFCDAHPGLAEALALGKTDGTKGESILADMASRFIMWRSLSEKQVALALKLADEIRNPTPEKPAERHAVAPTGRITFDGEIVSAKLRESEYGSQWKLTIKVTTEDGSIWLAWGTAPATLLAAVRGPLYSATFDMGTALRGARVRMTATLERPRAREANAFETDALRTQIEQRNGEQYFVIMSRPSGGLLTYGPVAKAPKRTKRAAAIDNTQEEAA